LQGLLQRRQRLRALALLLLCGCEKLAREDASRVRFDRDLQDLLGLLRLAAREFGCAREKRAGNVLVREL